MAVLRFLDMPLKKEFNDFPNCVIEGQFIFFIALSPTRKEA